ncbi:L,D-transpeptidase family protein [Sphingomonas sp. 10B4]|uniref:L,D-transpeptidase family protein n=1 Tax=Sphingomonas sp. 10B4 TaxID=3048575 RepID=UPI002AB5835D|nr:L,D-transpeptidase family protein [Sphingomonas sp. 10B4]MDY7524625.1 L,D-transpeptidase family protein [Sphingomonas sp. 10B4]MEB0282419.1 L,D-transpeptidase family protein [Sphingomonas sp. 10B4]
MTYRKTRPLRRITLSVMLLSGCNYTSASSAQPRHTDLPADTSATPSPTLTADLAASPQASASWSDANAAELDEALGNRAVDGLDHIDFGTAPTLGESAATRDAALTRIALRYATALALGVADPTVLHPIYTIPRPHPDLAAALSRALRKGDLAQWFATLAPQDDEYRALSKAYLANRGEAQTASAAVLRSGDAIQPGDHDDRIPTIAEHLAQGEYLGAQSSAAAQSADAGRYTPPMVDAVKALQRDYGVADDGVIGEKTLAILNLRPGDRARALAVAMERRRWLSRTPPGTRVDVNVAAARLYYYRDGKLVDERRVIAGQPGKETPPLLAPIYRLVANPTWTIPKSIQNGEMAHVARAYLRRHNMVLRNGWIVQKPGPSNALGVVKFDMKDDQAIYLHDTSNRSLFARSQRHLSHGCVRVENAAEFAQRLADDEGIGDRWRKAQASGRHRFVALPHAIPVRLLYHNVFIDPRGGLAFRTDPYDWNPAVATALGFGDGAHMRAKADAIDVGP